MNRYLIITSSVFDSDISSRSKLLFALISGLTDGEDGYCYASNKYLSEKMKISERQVINLIKELENYNFIHIKQVNYQRQIYIHTDAQTGRQKIAAIDRMIKKSKENKKSLN